MYEKMGQPKEEDDNFMPHGFDGNPSLYGEQKLALNYGQMTTEVLDAKVQLFISILNDPKTLPTHRAAYARLIDHIAFETDCREAERLHLENMLGSGVLNLLEVENPSNE